ncbi:sulfur oxidation c-type cytochrome SoxX [Aestuariibius sp. 2305UL40-4]|uniref:sulfur oxidation c-type cytochrome SoxX n=1 Tax=Aestuariibius violaceus TaxID=3234132 RepID=UPI00345E1B6D
MTVLRFAAIAALLLTPAAWAETLPAAVDYDDYGSVAASLTGAPGDSENGRLLMATRAKGNCIACHAITDLEEFPFHGEVGPTLDGVADRWTEADLRGIVANAKRVFPETVMPAFYKSSGYIRPGDAFTGEAGAEPLPPLLTAQEVEDVVAYLVTLKEE